MLDDYAVMPWRLRIALRVRRVAQGSAVGKVDSIDIKGARVADMELLLHGILHRCSRGDFSKPFLVLRASRPVEDESEFSSLVVRVECIDS